MEKKSNAIWWALSAILIGAILALAGWAAAKTAHHRRFWVAASWAVTFALLVGAVWWAPMHDRYASPFWLLFVLAAFISYQENRELERA